MESQRQVIEQAAAQAELAAQNAEAAAATATTNADVAAQAAVEARNWADQLAEIAAQLAGPSDFIYLLALFVLAIFVGYYVVWSVTPALHTPLMSVTNAVSSVVIVGALIAVGADVMGSAAGGWSKTFGFLAVVLASVNIFGGFLVTQRMLSMYKKKGT